MEEKGKIEGLLEGYQKQLEEVKDQIKQIEQEQMRLQKVKDQVVTKGIELQGSIKALQQLVV